MQPFHYRDRLLFAEDVNLMELADAYGTPCYVYSTAAITHNYQAFARALQAWPTRICYAVKANSNLAILNILVKLGANFDIVSIGELERVIRAGGAADKIVFSGVAKRADEIRRALIAGIYCFNIESIAELEQLAAITKQMDTHANVSLRVNPDVDPSTHPYIATGLKASKFGIDIKSALKIYHRIARYSHLHATGVDCHIGSQLLDLAPIQICLQRIFELIDSLNGSGIHIRHVDIGGGLGIRYMPGDQAPSPVEYARVIAPFMRGRKLELLIEPGRAITGEAGILLTRVEHLKSTGEKNFAIVDAGMNDLARPCLYSAWHDIIQVQTHDNSDEITCDVVGPVCENSDFLGKNRRLCIQRGSLLAIQSVGAYGFVMASNYNSRVRAAEVLVDREQAWLIRRRETIEQLVANEIIPDTCGASLKQN